MRTMQLLLALLAILCLSACGASYSVMREYPDGSRIVATAKTAEKAGAIRFAFEGDPGGEMRIHLEKQNVEPVVSMPLEGLTRLLDRLIPVAP